MMKERFGKATEDGKVFGTTLKVREELKLKKKKEDRVRPGRPCSTREKAEEGRDSKQTRYTGGKDQQLKNGNK